MLDIRLEATLTQPTTYNLSEFFFNLAALRPKNGSQNFQNVYSVRHQTFMQITISFSINNWTKLISLN